MFGNRKRPNAKLDELINDVLTEMKEYGPDAPEYPALLEKVERLYDLMEKDTHSRVDANTLFTVLGNVACVLIIVGYEQKHVISSKALTFVARLANRAPNSL